MTVLERAKGFLSETPIGASLQDAKLVISELIAECKRLQADNIHWRQYNQEIYAECQRWQKIARDERADRIAGIPVNNLKDKQEAANYRTRAAQEIGIPSSDPLRDLPRSLSSLEGISISYHIRDATKMVLTEEQRAALEYALGFFHTAEVEKWICTGDVEYKNVLRSMLSQSSPAWQITEERKAAIRDAFGISKVASIGNEDAWAETIDTLHEMLEECEK